jgi:uncharacterized cofD-like protein
VRTIDSIAQSVRLVALGGGTGLPVVLRGLKAILYPNGAWDRDRLVAVVTVSDDGGSSGRLRAELHDMLPPGDIRNCLVALSHNRPLVSRLFRARYRHQGGSLEGHSVGNLILAALAQEEGGSFLDALRVASQVLNVRGRVLPLTLEPSALVAEMDGGETIRGECAITSSEGRIRRLVLDPEDPPATPGIVEAIESADVVVLGPGSLFSSIVPNLLVSEVRDALARTKAFRILVLNAMTEAGETAELGAAEHVRAVFDHGGSDILDAALVPTDAISDAVLARYAEEGARRVNAGDPDLDVLLPMIVRENVLQAGPKVRHDAMLVARAILRAYAAWRTSPRSSAPSSKRAAAGARDVT